MIEYESSLGSQIKSGAILAGTVIASYVALKGPEMLQEPAQRVIGLLRDFESRDPMYIIMNKGSQEESFFL